MTTVRIQQDQVPPMVQPIGGTETARNALLVCGILGSLLYIAMNVFIPMQWEEYSVTSQTVSELSAIGAPTRQLWVPLGIIYTLLMTSFGCGLWMSVHASRPLRVAGGLIVAHGLIGLAWPPMHLREVLAAGGGTLTDTLHIVWAAATSVLMLLSIGFAAASFGKQFRFYSIASLVVLLVFGTLTSVAGPRISQNLPTPWLGVWERICIAAYMVWVIVVAAALMRRTSQRLAPHQDPAPILKRRRKQNVA